MRKNPNAPQNQEHTPNRTLHAERTPSRIRKAPQNPGTPQSAASNRRKGQAPLISIIIPSAPGRSFDGVIENLRRVRPPNLPMQIIVVKGAWPPLQRNLAIKKATGDFLFLFDDDIIVPPGSIEQALRHFAQNPEAAVVGGPNLTPPENSFIQHCFGLAHSSYFTGAQTAARYFPARNLKNPTESHLISCNLAFRAVVLKKNLFDPRIFPNEENDLLARIQRQKHKLAYDPGFFVYHHRRKNLFAYMKQIFNWGAGRTLHSLSRPAHFNPVFFVPLAFTVYLASLAFYRPPWYLAPLALYLALDIAFSFSAMVKNAGSFTASAGAFFMMLWLFPLTHIMYALGQVYGFFKSFGPKPALPAEESFSSIEIDIA